MKLPPDDISVLKKMMERAKCKRRIVGEAKLKRGIYVQNFGEENDEDLESVGESAYNVISFMLMSIRCQ